jgi:CBS domain-containing protein
MDEPSRAALTVRDIMHAAPASVRPNATLDEALQLMADRKARHVVVLEPVEHSVVGILSDRDLALYYDPAQMTAERWREARVSQLMAPNPITIGSGSSLREAARILLKTGISALPVVDNGELVGLLSDREFVRFFASGE